MISLLVMTENRQFHSFIIITMILIATHDSAIRWRTILTLSNYPVTPRKEPNLSYRILRAIYPAFRLSFPSQVIRADDLARAMVDGSFL